MRNPVYLGEENYEDSKFYWSNIEHLDTVRALRRDKSGAVDVDGLSSRLITMALPRVLPILTHIFNFSLTFGVYPSAWKTSIICPVPKVSNPSELRDFRPISILCATSKILERVVAEQITGYLEEACIWDPYQSAYRKGHSTQTALIRVLDDIRRAADMRMVTVVVFFDFTKAFDYVNHSILIDKLRTLGFSCSALRWLCSHLHVRSQVVRDPITRLTSSERLIASGVPQGSVLGPLLFALYLSDFGSALSHCKYNFYADDLLIYLHSEPRCLTDAILKVDEDINGILKWVQYTGFKPRQN